MRALSAVAGAVLVAATLAGCTTLKRWAYEGIGRDRWQRPDEVLRALAIPAGAQVADLGAGGGYFTFRLAAAAGPTGRVYAVDVDPGMVDYLRERAAREGARTVVPVLATADDARLPAASVDLLFTCNTYHHLTDRAAYFTRLRPVLRGGGRVAVVEYDGRGLFGRLFGHATPADEIRREMAAAGYRVVGVHDFLPRQSFLVFALDAG
jgi:ubiquinone/menaquinone biosynthesis C-methylase UbiE